MSKLLKYLFMSAMILSFYSASSWADDGDDDLNLSDSASSSFYLNNSYCLYYPDLPECLSYIPGFAYYGWNNWGGRRHHHRGSHHGGHHGGHHRR